MTKTRDLANLVSGSNPLVDGVHLLGGTPLRKNYAGIGYVYDADRDAFYAPSPYPSWSLDEDTCLWEAPVAHPNDGLDYTWDEPTLAWIEITE